MIAPLSDPLPLRLTTVWPDYETEAVIPWIFGRARVTPLRYDVSGRRYVLADHALAGVDGVTLDDMPLAGWGWSNGADSTGHACAFLDLAEPPGTKKLAAEVRGLSGNPADILAALGVRDDLQEFRLSMNQAGLTLGGALTQARTGRAGIQFVIDQVGGCWSAGMPGYAALFPPAVTDPTWAMFGPLERGEVSFECVLIDVVTRLVIPFDEDASSGKNQQTATLLSASAADYGERALTLNLPWVKTAREAAAVGQRWLQWRSRPLWTLKFNVGPDARTIPPGGWIVLSGADSPIQGRAVVMDIDPGIGSGVVSLTAQAPAGSAPVITVAGTGQVLPALVTAYQVQQGADTLTLTLTDADGGLLPFARVWLDGIGPQTADGSATLTLSATPGRHTLRVEAPGQSPFTTEIEF